MPIYTYECDCGKRYDVFQRMSETSPTHRCKCGSTSRKVYHVPMAHVESECPAHKFPGTSEVVNSNARRKYLMDKHNLVDANDFTPAKIIEEQRQRTARAQREASKLNDCMDAAMKQEVLEKHVLTD